MLSKNVLLIGALLLVVIVVQGDIDSRCLGCICQVESGCSPKKCAWDVNSISCGYYQLKKVYWVDCKSPGESFESCAASKACSEKCVRAYMARYASRCTGNREPTCEDYARIHNGGPNGCKNSNTNGYWKKVSDCYS